MSAGLRVGPRPDDLADVREAVAHAERAGRSGSVLPVG